MVLVGLDRGADRRRVREYRARRARSAWPLRAVAPARGSGLRCELSRETAAMNGVILLQAGHETTASMIALGTRPQMIANIVEELMRYLTIVHSQVDRVAVEDPRRSADSCR